MIRPLFGPRRKGAVASEDMLADPTIKVLKSGWRCSCCGEWHHGVMDLAAGAPDPWPHEESYEPNSALRLDGDFLSEDFCVLGGEDFFVRSVLEIPVRGLDRPWGFGCWTTVSRTNFDKYVGGFDNAQYEDDGPWFGWLANRLKIYFEDEVPISVDVFPQPARQRPRLVVQDADRPLAIAQGDGISAEDMLVLLRAYGHGPTAQ